MNNYHGLPVIPSTEPRPDVVESPKRSRRTSDIRWNRLVAEGAAIVVSILLAFAIDAWWDSRIASREEREHLISLQAEFSRTRDLIEADIAQLTDGASAVTGALDALLASGDIGLLRNDDLATRLAAWPSFVREVNENAERLVISRDEELLPFTSSYMGGLWLSRTTPWLAGYPKSHITPRTSEMFADRRLEGQLATRAVRIEVTLDRYRTLGAQADTIIAEIQRALGR